MHMNYFFKKFVLVPVVIFTLILFEVFSAPVLANTHNSGIAGIVPNKLMVKYKGQPDTVYEKGFSLKASGSESSYTVKTIDLSPGENVFEAIERMKKDPNIEYVEPVYIYKIADTYRSDDKYGIKDYKTQNAVNDAEFNNQWWILATEMEKAWEKVSEDRRKDVTVAVLDTGIDSDHPDLAGSIVPGYDFVNGDSVPEDDNGHGTHVAGIIGAIANNTIGIAGAASGVKIMPVKVLDANGEGDSGKIIEGIKWAVNHGADIINMSLERSRYIVDESGKTVDAFSQIEYEAIQYALEKGVIMVAAVGNESNHWTTDEPGDLDIVQNDKKYDSPVGYPAAYSGVLGVGAVDWYSNTGFIIADFSNTGDEVDVAAPGVGIISTYLNSNYEYESGTSQAAPIVSGLAALLKAGDESLSNEDIEKTIMESAIDLGEPGVDTEFGFGLVNGYRAFNLPRLEIVPDTPYPDTKGRITGEIMAKAYNNTVSQEVYGAVQVFVDRYDFDNNRWLLVTDIDNTVVDMVYGSGNLDIVLPDAGYFSLYADEYVYGSQNTEFISSRPIYMTFKPQKPVASLAPGTYNSSQTVALTCGTRDAKIYYTLNGEEPTTSSLLYQTPITISSSVTIKAISFKNGVTSDVGVYSYTINRTDDGGLTSGGSGGSGGAGSTAEPKQNEIIKTKDDSGRIKMLVKISPDLVEKELKSLDKSDVTLDVTTQDAVDSVEVEMDAKTLDKVLSAHRGIVIKSNNVEFKMDADFLASGGGVEKDGGLRLTVNESDFEAKDIEATSGAAPVSKIFEFEIYSGHKKIGQFAKPVTVTMKYDAKKVLDINKVGVYWLNEATHRWDYVGGKAVDKGITFETEHFSKYAVMEYNKTFKDITSHWAKYDIELMAAKHIIKGVSQNEFAPERSITRAEFTALIARALNIKEQGAQSNFIDVSDEAWYKDAVMGAARAGIISGVDASHFAPEKKITRQEMAVIIVKAYSYVTGKKLSDIYTTSEVKFRDEGAVNSWARSYVRLADALGLMNGNPDGTFAPGDSATRAQAAVIIKRMLEKSGKL
ncbi:hypothetical protein D2962_13155 [Biomaibacter acetigenes]|uniref:SLH domain-containing protein n=2 Tax=Biomaibacter acetigenes TaxID=2316383 RepID=A0A3G2R7N4_9FIRM|nr:hypothetical protein D2962_13155 [Biomaibacter acetigenes]